MYETLSSFAQTWGLVAFVLGFVAVLIYALRPGAKKTFEDAAKAPLSDEPPAAGKAEPGKNEGTSDGQS